MTKSRFNLRNVVAIAICLAGVTMFSSCSNDDKNKENGGNGGNNATVAITLDLLKSEKENEIIVKCTPACPWAEAGYAACYFNQPGDFLLLSKQPAQQT